MTQEEIIKGNKLIAEFNGKGNYSYYGHSIELYGTPHYPKNKIKYHISWDWLMPVVEKIIKEYMTDYYNEYDMGIPNSYYVAIGSDGKYSSQGISKNSLIEATWLSVIEFIKWYNKNKEINE